MGVYALSLAIVFVAFIGPVELSCPANWVHHRNSCYFFSNGIGDWDQSMEYCRTLGGYLAEIEDLDESNFLTKELLHRGHGYFYWIGGKDEIEGTWIWMNSGHHFNYTYWQPGEPNNSKYNNGVTENCAHIVRVNSYHWNDGTCYTQANFICEKSLQESGLEPLVPPGLG